jgi:hypothetical protein
MGQELLAKYRVARDVFEEVTPTDREACALMNLPPTGGLSVGISFVQAHGQRTGGA